jgi:hypothetical protein
LDLWQVFRAGAEVALVMEYAPAGDLFDYVKERDGLVVSAFSMLKCV